MYLVYVLRSESTGKRYIGQTANIVKRLEEHGSGLSRYTKGRGPWKLIYTEEFQTRAEAIKRERALKGGQGREFLNNLGK
jgi:putative endonuclease